MEIDLTSGTVLGIDVGYSPTQRTTCFCTLAWDRSAAWLEFRLTSSDLAERTRALVDLIRGRELIGVAIDGPLTRELRLVPHYRAAEAILSRGVLQERGKPGQTSAPVGQELHKHATLLANLVLDSASVRTATHLEPIHEKRLVEAFPNIFLGALIDEHALPRLARDASDRYWEAVVERGDRLVRLLEYLLPERRLEIDLRDLKDHDHRAGAVCALTALSVSVGDYVAVGDPEDGDILLPPLAMWGSSSAGSGTWLESVLLTNVDFVQRARRAHPNHGRARILSSLGPWRQPAT